MMTEYTTEYIDISIPVSSDVLVYPGDPSPRLLVTNSGRAGDNWNVGAYEGGLHVGTHLDAPWHRIMNGKRLHEIELTSFLGLCLVLDLKDLDRDVSADVLEDFAIPRYLQRLVIKTRNSQREYWREPWNHGAVGIDRSAAEWCVARSLSLVGIDYPSIERLGEHAIHEKLLEHDIVILEGLRLGHVSPGWYELIAAPVKLMGTDGAWCRALLRSPALASPENRTEVTSE